MPAYGRASEGGVNQGDEGEKFRDERTPAPVLSGPPDDAHPAGKIVVGDVQGGGAAATPSDEEPGAAQDSGAD